MRRSTLSLAALGAVATLAVAACGSSSNNSSSSSGSSAASGSSSAGAVSAVCKAPSSAAAGASAPVPSGLKASGKVGVILPDTTSSTRYTLYDAPLLKQAFTAAGLQPDIQNSGGSTSKQQQIAQSMIGEGVKVILLDSIDQTSGAAVESAAKAAGIKVIDYDRVNTGGGSAQYYVSFDNEGVGKLQGQTLADCLGASGKANPKVILMDGGTDVDNNAVLFAKGAKSVLQPLADQKKLTIVSESVVKGWKVANAAPAFTQALTAAGGQVDGVLAANDDIANAVIGVLQTSGLAGHVVITGQDAGVSGLQNILKGTQSMTIFKNVAQEANAAAALTIALIGGKDPSAVGITFVSGIDPQNAGLKSLLLKPEVITQGNVQDVVTAGALKASEICNGIQAQCDAAGVK